MQVVANLPLGKAAQDATDPIHYSGKNTEKARGEKE